jgi:uncharacterized protein YgbK (DUF1537 family)
VAEKTGGHVPADAVLSVGLRDIREGGPEAVRDLLAPVEDRCVIVVNAATYRDVDVFVWGMMQAERQGRRFLFRTAASFVKVRGGISDRGLLAYRELYPTGQDCGTGGLTVVGSYVQRTTEQLDAVLKLGDVLRLELCVAHVLDVQRRAGEINHVLSQAERALRQGRDVVLYTSRELIIPEGMPHLQAGQRVSEALVDIVRRLSIRPAYLIGKGGITSSDLATDGLGIRRAQVLGQILPGVPVWRMGPDSRYPRLPYVVFPGNVGGPDALAQVIQVLRGEEILMGENSKCP